MHGFLSRINLKVKMGLMVVVFTALIGAFAYTLLSEWRAAVAFSQKELYGTELYTPAFQLIKNAQLHRGNSFQVVKGNESARSKMLSARGAFNKALEEMKAIEQLHANEMDLGSALGKIEDRWIDLSAAVESMPPNEGFSTHTQLIGEIIAYIEYFSDQSNLTLDPEVESFYQMQLLSFTLPKAIEHSARLRGKVSGAIAPGVASQADINKLLSMKPIAMDKMNEAVAAAEKASAASNGALDGHVVALKAAQNEFSTLVQNVMDTGRSPLNASEMFAKGTTLVAAGYALADGTIPLLRQSLNQRVDAMKSKNNNVTTVLVIAYLVVFAFVIVVLRSILRSLSRSNVLLEEIKHGNLENDVDANGSDELAELIRGVGSLQTSLRETREREQRAAEEMEKANEETQRIAAESKKIADALSVCDTSVMIADNRFDIVYLNKAAYNMFEKREAVLQAELPRFSLQNLKGANVDLFHKNQGQQGVLTQPISDVLRTQIVIGELTFKVTATPLYDVNGDRSGTIIEWQDCTDALLLEAEAKRIADENRRVRIALDNSSNNTMIADTENNIIYMNSSIKGMMGAAEADIKQDLPAFNAAQLMGANMDVFHKDPTHQRGLIAGLKNTYRAQVNVGGRTFSLNASPVMDDQGERLGTVVEWTDRTQEIKMEQEVAELVHAASRGDFTQSLQEQGKEGFFKALATGLNQLMKVTNEGIADVANVLSALASGDLSKRITSDYDGLFKQLKDDTNATSEKLEEVITSITHASRSVSNGAEEIAAGNANLSQRTEQQAASLEETASSMEEMTATVKQTSENAHKANTLSTSAVSIAESGGEVVEKAVSAMTEINESSNRIADIIGVIDEIAFQTNLLALNAAVEAARAGEQGRGFAVVAGEVRNLAQRSASAAKEIKDLIRDSVSKVEAGTHLVNESGQTLTEIVESIQTVSRMISDINNASKEQSASIAQINQSVTQMDEMTQQNAALVEEASAAGEAVAEQARNLNSLVRFFHIDTEAEDARAHAGVPTASPLTGSRTSVMSTKDSGSDINDDWEEF